MIEDGTEADGDILREGEDQKEGLKQTITVNKYQRNKLTRVLYLKKQVFICKACGFEFAKFRI